MDWKEDNHMDWVVHSRMVMRADLPARRGPERGLDCIRGRGSGHPRNFRFLFPFVHRSLGVALGTNAARRLAGDPADADLPLRTFSQAQPFEFL